MGHHHPHENTRAVVNRISRVTGHMESIKRMVEEGRDCSEILIQLSAVRAAINNIGRIVLQDHIDHCVVDAVKTGDQRNSGTIKQCSRKVFKIGRNKMLKKLSDFLAGIPMTVTGGVFLAVSLVMMLSGIEFPVDPAWITVLICGVPLVYLALTRLLWQKWISSALLITIAMIAAISIGELFAAGEVAFIMAIGAILEDLTVARAKKGIGKLISLVPQTGRRIRTVAGKEKLQEVRADEIRVGDLLRVLPGEAIPVDGEIFAGNTSVDQSVMTGESLPVDKKTGDTVFCGTINRFGAIDIRAMQVGKDSSLQKMIDLVKEAENKQAPTQRDC